MYEPIVMQRGSYIFRRLLDIHPHLFDSNGADNFNIQVNGYSSWTPQIKYHAFDVTLVFSVHRQVTRINV